jgi:hypothetical protein
MMAAKEGWIAGRMINKNCAKKFEGTEKSDIKTFYFLDILKFFILLQIITSSIVFNQLHLSIVSVISNYQLHSDTSGSSI